MNTIKYIHVILVLCITMPSILMSMEPKKGLSFYESFITQRVQMLADIQPPLTHHQIARLIQDCERHAPDDRLNLVNACQVDDVQAVDQILRTLINEQFRGNIFLHRGCNSSFCKKDAAEKYHKQIYKDKNLEEMHHFNRHQLWVMMQGFQNKTDNTKELYKLITNLYYKECSEQDKQKMAYLTLLLVEQYKDKMNAHKDCTGQGFCFMNSE